MEQSNPPILIMDTVDTYVRELFEKYRQKIVAGKMQQVLHETEYYKKLLESANLETGAEYEAFDKGYLGRAEFESQSNNCRWVFARQRLPKSDNFVIVKNNISSPLSDAYRTCFIESNSTYWKEQDFVWLEEGVGMVKDEVQEIKHHAIIHVEGIIEALKEKDKNRQQAARDYSTHLVKGPTEWNQFDDRQNAAFIAGAEWKSQEQINFYKQALDKLKQP